MCPARVMDVLLGAGRGTHHYAAIVYAPDNGCACAGRLRQRDTPLMESDIAIVIGEVEAWHGVGGRKGGRGNTREDINAGRAVVMSWYCVRLRAGCIMEAVSLCVLSSFWYVVSKYNADVMFVVGSSGGGGRALCVVDAVQCQAVLAGRELMTRLQLPSAALCPGLHFTTPSSQTR